MANFVNSDKTKNFPLPEKFYLSRKEQLTTDLLQRIISRHVTFNKPTLQVWKDYFDGLQPILDKKYDDENRSCNRLVTNFCRNITYSYLGYLAAPNHITYQSNNDISALIDILNYNDCSSEDQAYLKDALVYGVGNELMYLDEQANARFKNVSPLSSFGIFDDCLSGVLLYFVRMYKASEWDTSNKYYVDVYSDKKIQHYESIGEIGALTFIGEEPHYFSQCPANVFYLEDNESIFNCILTLQDAYNTIQSDQVDDVDAFTSAYLVFTGNFDVKTLKTNMIQMKESRGIYLPGENTNVDFLTKSTDDTQAKNSIERIQAAIYRIAQCPDFSSESFVGGVSSGIAIKYRLTGMETRAATIEASMKKALQRRIEILCGFVSLKFGEEVYRDIKINFERNIPEDLSTVATAVSQLNGIVSDETLLSILPFVDNPKEEAEKVKDQKQSQMDIYSNAFVTGDKDGEEEE